MEEIPSKKDHSSTETNKVSSQAGGGNNSPLENDSPIKPPPAEIEKILAKVPAQEREKLRQYIVHIETQFSGPIPPPSLFAGYERVLPGSGDRIFKLTENQQNHRQSLEAKVVSSNIWNERIGLIFGFILAFTLILGGIVIILAGKDAAGLATIGTVAAAIAIAYVTARLRVQRELKENRETSLAGQNKKPVSSKPSAQKTKRRR